MQPGELVLHNDVLGVVLSVDDTTVVVRNREGKMFTFRQNLCTSIIKPAALATLIYQKFILQKGGD